MVNERARWCGRPFVWRPLHTGLPCGWAGRKKRPCLVWSFVVRRSSFVVRRSSFVFRRWLSVVRRSSFVVGRVGSLFIGVITVSLVALLHQRSVLMTWMLSRRQDYKFNIINFVKKTSLFQSGMRPLAFSVKESGSVHNVVVPGLCLFNRCRVPRWLIRPTVVCTFPSLRSTRAAPHNTIQHNATRNTQHATQPREIKHQPTQ